MQLTEQASNAATCQQAAAQVAQLKGERLETILLLAKQVTGDNANYMRHLGRRFCQVLQQDIHVKLHKCEDAHDEKSQRKHFRAYGKLHDFITTHTDSLCSTVLAD